MKELTIALAAAVVLSTAVASAAPVSFSDELKITIGTTVDSDQFLTESDESTGPPVLVGTPDIIPAFSNMSSESTLAVDTPSTFPRFDAQTVETGMLQDVTSSRGEVS